MAEIGQLVNEISSFPEVLYKRGDLKNFSKFTDSKFKILVLTRSSHPEVFLSKDVLKSFCKIHR